jgi:hypothetical protein
MWFCIVYCLVRKCTLKIYVYASDTRLARVRTLSSSDAVHEASRAPGELQQNSHLGRERIFTLLLLQNQVLLVFQIVEGMPNLVLPFGSVWGFVSAKQGVVTQLRKMRLHSIQNVLKLNGFPMEVIPQEPPKLRY